MTRIRVIVLGASGRMGLVILRSLMKNPLLKLVGAVDVCELGTDVGSLINQKDMGICITDRIPEIPLTSEPVVAIDFTQPGVASQNILECLELGYHCVVGTTGIDEEKIDLIKERAEKAQLGVLIAPNFAIGAVLMMRFARIAAKYMSTSEIIEQHHDRKIDAPSGTSLMTAQLISEVQRNSPKEKQKELLKLQGVRGGNLDGVNIHSLRLPGFLAHHTVIFGDEGQTLTLRHDSINRESFMPGVMLAIDEIHRMKGLFIGLENLMKWN